MNVAPSRAQANEKGLRMGVSVVAMEGWMGRARGQLPANLAARGCTDPAVLRAMLRVPRDWFLADELREEAYLERSLPIGEGQRIASPGLVARTLQLLSLQPHERMLELGTGSGYSAAVASHLAREVYTVERNANLARQATCFLGRAGFRNVHVRPGEGADAWADAGPFDAISVSFSAPSLVRPLLARLRIGGRLVMAMGNTGVSDALLLVTRTPDGFVENPLLETRFGPSIAVLPPAQSAAGFPYARPCA